MEGLNRSGDSEVPEVIAPRKKPFWQRIKSNFRVNHETPEIPNEHSGTYLEPEESILDEQQPSREINQGIDFQRKNGDYYTDGIPDYYEEGVLALLGSNEKFNYSEIKSEVGDPDGYICGIGFGNILTMVTLFEKDTLPKGIMAVDISPEVILTGRIAVRLMKESTNYEEFLENLSSKQRLEELRLEVFNDEDSDLIKTKLMGADTEKIFYGLKMALEESSNIRKNEDYLSYKPIPILSVIRDNYQKFKQLAEEGNIGISLADITDEKLVTDFGRLKGFDVSRNIIYFSTAMDHITKRGADLGPDNIKRLLFYDRYKVLDNGKNRYIHSTNKKGYVLEALKSPPIYTQDDYMTREEYIAKRIKEDKEKYGDEY